jgi:hypothetical protein
MAALAPFDPAGLPISSVVIGPYTHRYPPRSSTSSTPIVGPIQVVYEFR